MGGYGKGHAAAASGDGTVKGAMSFLAEDVLESVCKFGSVLRSSFPPCWSLRIAMFLFQVRQLEAELAERSHHFAIALAAASL
jgi:hypothetical protein